MKEKFCVPNLPSSKVARVFVSGIMPFDLRDELKSLGITPHKLGQSKNLSSELAFHPDILLNNFKKGVWLCEHDAKYLPKDLPRKWFLESETELGELYPYDCAFNNFKIRNALVCGRGVDYMIRAYAEYDEQLIILVAQNYTKCCTVIVNNFAIITSDISIAKAMRKNGFDVLTIEDSCEIGLRGYSHGLIGGCAGKISNDTIAFTGNLERYKFGKDIISFCDNHGVDCISLTDRPMYDYGGILPITEYIKDDDDDSDDISKEIKLAEDST